MLKLSLFSHVIRPDDDPTTVFKKKVLLIISLLNTVFFSPSVFTADDHMVTRIRKLMMALASAVLFVQIAVEKKVRNTLVVAWLFSSGATFLFHDLVFASLNGGDRAWPYFVLIIDVCLVCRLGNRVTTCFVITIVIWLSVLVLENTYRFGLYDLSFLASQDKRREIVSCEELPCARDLFDSLRVYLGQVLVFLLDAYFTRGFAYGLEREHDKMNQAIVAAEQIATSLSCFDLVSAEEIISTTSLPPPLYDAFSNILGNLRIYRPYIPDALFHSMHDENQYHQKEVPIPGLVTGKAALVFTDIQGSTATWEACPEGMKEGLQVHNKAIRECIFEHNGYEVKTIGDSFMVAFESASDAVWFGLSVQEKLVESVWPEELLELDSCTYQTEGPWCGLRVRIGVHCGEVSVQLNTLTGRYDYFGNTVNKAARMEGACVGGAVAVTPEVLEVGDPLDPDLIIPMGKTELKGVKDHVNPFLIIPRELLGRKAFLERQLLLKREDRGVDGTGRNRSSSRCSGMSAHSRENRFRGDNIAQIHESVSATVGNVEVVLGNYDSHVEMGIVMNNGLAKIVTCSERSHGAMVSLQGNRAAVCWNGPKVCTTHVENSLAFVKMLGVVASLGADSSLHVGMSTSSVAYGTVGLRRQRFVTVLGTSVVLSHAMCEKAVSSLALCYYATPFELSEMEGLDVTPAGTREVHKGPPLLVQKVELKKASSVLGHVDNFIDDN